ncbi:hypothetical protein KKF45_04660 [Patescibacteria group bacterium]|nr:hypothetical protein [Patescibacteria group bacterium]
MGRETVTREIGGETYRVTPLVASKGWPLLIALSKLVGAPLGRAVGAVAGDEDVNPKLLAEAVEALTSRLDEDAVHGMTMRLLAGAEVKKPKGWVSVSGQFDLLFQGDYSSLISLLGMSLEVNYNLPLAAWLSSARQGLRSLDTPPPASSDES